MKVACTVRSGGKSALTAERQLFSKSGGLPIAIGTPLFASEAEQETEETEHEPPEVQ